MAFWSRRGRDGGVRERGDGDKESRGVAIRQVMMTTEKCR
jgi:hypothetical protein